MTSIKWNGKEVEHPTARKLVAMWAIVMGGVGMLVAGFTFFVIVPLSLPLHFLLRLVGRRGFVIHESDGFSYIVSFDGFKRA